MFQESNLHYASRIRLAQQPVYMARFFHTPRVGGATDYPFSVDFTTGFVSAPTKPKLRYLAALSTIPSNIEPERGAASVGGQQLTFVDTSRNFMRYLSYPQLTIIRQFNNGDPALYLNDVEPLPDPPCTVEITAADVNNTAIERVRYTQKDVGGRLVSGLTRGVDGTTAYNWGTGNIATNGEQIRSGQRMRFFSGYGERAEEEYMPWPTMQVNDVAGALTDPVFTVSCTDVIRMLRRQVFLTRTDKSVLDLSGHPFDIALRVLLSTGLNGINSSYDVLAATDGAGVPESFIDIAYIEEQRALFPNDNFCFEIRQREELKSWLQTEILQVVNAYPVVRQSGKLAFKLYSPYDFNV